MGSKAANSLLEELKQDAEKGELLLWASARGLTEDVIELVQTGADPSAKDKRSRQAVHYAASNGHLEILEYLFTKGVLLDAEDDVGRGALHYAAAGGHSACVLLLLGKGCWRDAPDAADDTPLHLAARSGSVETVRTLLDARAKLGLLNKRSLTPFAEAVLAGHTEIAELLGAAAEGGLRGALTRTYREVPLLHLAAGLGLVTAVEWLVRQQQQQQHCDVLSDAATERRYTPLHAAALSGDANTVTALLKLGADPLGQTRDGKLPLELVPRAAPTKTAAAAATVEDANPAAAAAAVDPVLVRSARRAFRALARAAAEQGGVELGSKELTAAAGVPEEAAAAATVEENGGQEEEEEKEEEDGPAALCLRQLLCMSHEQRIAKVESYGRMDERQLQELSYLDVDARAAVAALRQTMCMVELFGAIAALRADEDFQFDIRDPRVRDALAEARRTNDLTRYEDLPGVMSVAAKFKRLHAVTRKAGGLQVVIDDLRAELPGNAPEPTAAKMEEMRAAQRACAEAAVKAVLVSVTAAVPECVRERITNASVAAAAAADKGGDGNWKKNKNKKSSNERVGLEGEDEQAFKARMAAQTERMERLRTAASSAWSANKAEDEAVGYVDRLEEEFDAAAARAEGAWWRWRLADYLGKELAQSLSQTFRALLLTAAAFLGMWLLGLTPHQQTAALLARHEELVAAAAAVRNQLEGLGEDGGGAITAPAAPGTCPSQH